MGGKPGTKKRMIRYGADLPVQCDRQTIYVLRLLTEMIRADAVDGDVVRRAREMLP